MIDEYEVCCDASVNPPIDQSAMKVGIDLTPADEAAVTPGKRITFEEFVDINGETYRLIEGWPLDPSSLVVSLDTYVDLCRPLEPPKTSHRRSSYNYRSGFPKRRLRRFRGKVLSIIKSMPMRTCDTH